MAVQSKAAVLYKFNSPLVIETLDIAGPGAGQALVRLSASGVCHTQLLEVQGKRGKDPFLPHCLGHEGSGVVEAAGAGVTKVKPGDHVILSWIKGVGANSPAVSYLKGGQKINAGAVTTFNELAIVSENRLTPIRKDMPLDKAALIGCAFATGAGAVLNTARVKKGDLVAIFGAGGIGLNAVNAAAIAGAAAVIAVDISDANLERAVSFGATHKVNARTQDPVAAIQEITGGKGADAAIEAVGRKQTMEQAYECVRTGGGIAVLVGNLPFEEKISIDPFQLILGKRVVGSWGGETVPDSDFPKYVDLYLAGKLKLDSMITHRIKLEEVDKAFEWMEKGEAGRVLIEF